MAWFHLYDGGCTEDCGNVGAHEYVVVNLTFITTKIYQYRHIMSIYSGVVLSPYCVLP